MQQFLEGVLLSYTQISKLLFLIFCKKKIFRPVFSKFNFLALGDD